MFHSLVTLDDRDIAAILEALEEWCSARGVEIESDQGRRAMAIAVDHVQTKGTSAELLAEISAQLDG
ncbi:hypothetical protein [Rhizobium grahamii]|uniref:Uncharacterized protein n=2 Tax=Rhizobium grahamii TaxID=1120045 RepID=S3HSM0_9HYPH|nr:hypothetical protein [Rhizobium grahamii]EPE96211.1 hypothetical protein RGCCGE502_21575 [Rhizobium grahamii CCGE 502]RDJ03022.1 hypothetical protein B5K06_31565 [Rhizobium grahamii]